MVEATVQNHPNKDEGKVRFHVPLLPHLQNQNTFTNPNGNM